MLGGGQWQVSVWCFSKKPYMGYTPVCLHWPKNKSFLGSANPNPVFLIASSVAQAKMNHLLGGYPQELPSVGLNFIWIRIELTGNSETPIWALGAQELLPCVCYGFLYSQCFFIGPETQIYRLGGCCICLPFLMGVGTHSVGLRVIAFVGHWIPVPLCRASL